MFEAQKEFGLGIHLVKLIEEAPKGPRSFPGGIGDEGEVQESVERVDLGEGVGAVTPLGGDVGTVAAQFGAGETDERLNVDIIASGKWIFLSDFGRGTFAASVFATGFADDVDDGNIGASQLIFVGIGVDITDEIVVGRTEAAKGGAFIIGQVVVVSNIWQGAGVSFVDILALETGAALCATAGDGVTDIDVTGTVIVAVVAEAAAGVEIDVVFAVKDRRGAGTTNGDFVQSKFVADTEKHGIAVGEGAIFAAKNGFFEGGTADG